MAELHYVTLKQPFVGTQTIAVMADWLSAVVIAKSLTSLKEPRLEAMTMEPLTQNDAQILEERNGIIIYEVVYNRNRQRWMEGRVE